jgi:uncharacterized protein YbjT (DUF2867 family)
MPRKKLGRPSVLGSGSRRNRSVEMSDKEVILVTGATGLNGSAIIREFARNKVPVRALVRTLTKVPPLGLDTFPTVEIIEGDMLHPDTLSHALDGVERVLMISSANPQMVETQCAFIDACKAAGVSHVIKFSGAESGIGFDPMKFPFTRMHEQIEDYLEGSGLAWTHLRPSQFMQVYLREAPTIITESAILLPCDNIKLSPVDVEDIAKVGFALLSKGGHESKSYDMTGPEALTMPDIAERIAQAIGKPVRYINVSLEQRRRALLAAGVPAVSADALEEQAIERLKRPESRVYLGTYEQFGVEPTSFAEFARRNAAVFRGSSQGNKEIKK